MRGAFVQASSIANHGDPQRCVHRAVRIHQREQRVLQIGFGNIKRHVHPPGIPAHAPIMALKCEEDTFRDTQGAENSPTVHESGLARR